MRTITVFLSLSLSAPAITLQQAAWISTLAVNVLDVGTTAKKAVKAVKLTKRVTARVAKKVTGHSQPPPVATPPAGRPLVRLGCPDEMVQVNGLWVSVMQLAPGEIK